MKKVKTFLEASILKMEYKKQFPEIEFQIRKSQDGFTVVKRLNTKQIKADRVVKDQLERTYIAKRH